MSNLHEFINPPAPIGLTALTNDLLKQIEDLAIRVGGAEAKMHAAGKNAKAYYECCKELEAENAKLKKENDELLHSALTFAKGDDQGKNRIAELESRVNGLENEIKSNEEMLDQIRADDVAELKRWQWAINLRSASDDKRDGEHLADWLSGYVESLTKIESIPGSTDHSSLDAVWAERQRQIVVEGFSSERDDKYGSGHLAQAAACYALGDKYIEKYFGSSIKVWPWPNGWWKPKDQRSNLVKAGALILAEIDRLDRAAAREAESQAQAAEAITDAQAVQMIAQDLEANAEEIGLVATGVTNEQGQMLYCSKEEKQKHQTEQHAQASGAETEVETKLTALDVLKRDVDITKGGYSIHLGKDERPVDESCKVEVYLRNMMTPIIGFASEFEWEQTNSPEFVIAYRVHPNAEASAETKKQSYPIDDKVRKQIVIGNFFDHDGENLPPNLIGTERVKVLRRNGFTMEGEARQFDWAHHGADNDIIGYIVQPEPPASVVSDEWANELIKKGYTMHHGLGVPYSSVVRLECVNRSGERFPPCFMYEIYQSRWVHTGGLSDIIAYKVIP